MKSGASDPFGDDDDADRPDDDSASEPTDAGSATGDESTSTDGDAGRDATTERRPTAGEASSDSRVSDDTGTANPSGDDDTGHGALRRDQLPYVLRRERVKDERPEVHQLFVQAETHERAVDAERELEARLDTDLSRTDAREAIYLAGMAHLDDAAAVLRDWGYDL